MKKSDLLNRLGHDMTYIYIYIHTYIYIHRDSTKKMSAGRWYSCFFPNSTFAQPDLLTDFPHYLLPNCGGKRTLKMKSRMRFNCTHFGSPIGAFSAFLEVVTRFSSASARRVLQRSKGVCKPVNLAYTEEMESTNFPTYLTLCLVQKIWPSPK